MSVLSQRWPVRAGRVGWLAALAVSVAVIVGLAFIDDQVADLSRSLPPLLVSIAAFVTNFGDSAFILYPSLVLAIISAALLLLLRARRFKLPMLEATWLWSFVFLGVGTPGLITTIVKRLIGRGRPVLEESVGPFDFHGIDFFDWTYQSFPSGHTTTAFALCFVVSFLFPRAFSGMLLLAVLVALSRVVLGAHYPTDLAGGVLVGTLGAYAVRNVFASRGWLFRFMPDGTVARRKFTAWRRTFRSRTTAIPPPESSRRRS